MSDSKLVIEEGDPYRTPAEVNSTKIMTYVVGENQCICPNCGYSKKELTERYYINMGKICSPYKRRIISGMFWWRTRCPIPGTHYHCLCKRCGCSWIFKINPKLKMESIEEWQLKK